LLWLALGESAFVVVALIARVVTFKERTTRRSTVARRSTPRVDPVRAARRRADHGVGVDARHDHADLPRRPGA
jgi:hypothetical protein